PDLKWPGLTRKAGATPPHFCVAQGSMSEEIGYLFMWHCGYQLYLTQDAHFPIIMPLYKSCL
ncbi:MAG: hypothetical protein ABIG67_09170, partial [Pseudomonadota bacterium]